MNKEIQKIKYAMDNTNEKIKKIQILLENVNICLDAMVNDNREIYHDTSFYNAYGTMKQLGNIINCYNDLKNKLRDDIKQLEKWNEADEKEIKRLEANNG